MMRPVCKGKMGKKVCENRIATRYSSGRHMVFKPCENCGGTGGVADGKNNTPYSLEQIESFPYLFTVCNNWRRREIKVYQHPVHAERVIAVGKPMNGGGLIITDEPKADWREVSEQLYIFIKND